MALQQPNLPFYHVGNKDSGRKHYLASTMEFNKSLHTLSLQLGEMVLGNTFPERQVVKEVSNYAFGKQTVCGKVGTPRGRPTIISLEANCNGWIGVSQVISSRIIARNTVLFYFSDLLIAVWMKRSF